MGAIRGCLSRIGCLTLIVLGVTFGWLYRTEIEQGWQRAVTGSGAVVEGPEADGDAGSGARPSTPEGSRPGASGSGDASGSERTAGRGPGGAGDGEAEGAAADGGPDGAAAADSRDVAEAESIDAFLSAEPPVALRMDDERLADLVRRRVEPGLPEGIARPSATADDTTLSVAADVDLRRTLGDRLPSMFRRLVGDSSRVRARVVPSVPAPGVLRLRVREVRAGSVGLPTMTLPWLLTELGLPLASDDPTAVDLQVGRDLAEARVRDGVFVLVRSRPAAVPGAR